MLARGWAKAQAVVERQEGKLFFNTSLLLLDGAQRERKCRAEWQHLKDFLGMQSVRCAHD